MVRMKRLAFLPIVIVLISGCAAQQLSLDNFTGTGTTGQNQTPQPTAGWASIIEVLDCTVSNNMLFLQNNGNVVVESLFDLNIYLTQGSNAVGKLAPFILTPEERERVQTTADLELGIDYYVIWSDNSRTDFSC